MAEQRPGNVLDRLELDVQNVAIQEQQAAERLVRGRRR
jgi:hypothetical protein